MASERNLGEGIALQTQLLQTMQQQISRMNTINVHDPRQLTLQSTLRKPKMFEASWHNYCRATQIDEWPAGKETRKEGMLFNAIGEEALKR